MNIVDRLQIICLKSAANKKRIKNICVHKTVQVINIFVQNLLKLRRSVTVMDSDHDQVPSRVTRVT